MFRMPIVIFYLVKPHLSFLGSFFMFYFSLFLAFR